MINILEVMFILLILIWLAGICAMLGYAVVDVALKLWDGRRR